MKQPFYKFINYFSRRRELSLNRVKTMGIMKKLDKSSLVSNEDKKIFNARMLKIISYKRGYLVSPVQTSGFEIPQIRMEQEKIAEYMSKAKSKEDMELLKEIFKAIDYYFRLHEMFEQNLFFGMTLIVSMTIIMTPILVILL